MIGKDLRDGGDSECLETLSCNPVSIVNSTHILSIHHFVISKRMYCVFA